MPEFGQALLRECNRDWKAYYINYNRLKGWIKEMNEGHSKEAYTVFFEELETNLRRVDAFYSAQEALVELSIKELCSAPSPRKMTMDEDELEEEPDVSEDAERRQRISDSIEKLRCFAQMNCDGFRKITKKFDKKVGSGSHLTELPEGLQARMLEVVKTYNFADAEQRLDRFTNALQDWEEGREAMLPPLVKKKLSKMSLRAPLLEQQEGKVPGTVAKLSECAAKCLRWLIKNAGLVVLTLIVALVAFLNPSPKLSGKSYLVIWVTSCVLTFLVKQHAADSVLVGATLFLTICGVLDSEEAWQAFSNEVVLSVAGLGVIASAVGETGVIDLVFKAILGKPKSLPVAMLRLMLPSVLLNIGISNTCVMSCLLPVIDNWSKDIGMHKAYFLMPLSYLLLISGVFAIFSTSTNLVAQGLLIAHGQPRFAMFDLALPVVVSTLVTLVYLLVVTPIVLKRFAVEAEREPRFRMNSITKRTQNRYDVRVQVVGKQLDRTTLESSGILNMLANSMGDVYSCERYGSHVGGISEELELRLDDILWLRTSVDGISSLFYTPGLLFLALDLSEDYATLDPSSRQLVEAVLDKDSPLIGHRIGDARKYRPDLNSPIVAFRAFNAKQGLADKQASQTFLGTSVAALDTKALDAKEQVLPSQLEKRLSSQIPQSPAKPNKATKRPSWQSPSRDLAALVRKGSLIGKTEKPKEAADTEVRLQPGDHIIFNAPLSFYTTWKESSDFVVLRKITSSEPQADSDKDFAAMVSGCILLGLIALVATSTLPLLEAVFAALAALVLTQCTTMDFCVRAVKLRTVLTIVGAFGLGKAIGKERVAEVLADILIGALGRFGRRGLLVAIYGATVSLGIIFHGTAVVVLMFPICQEVSKSMGVPIHQTIAVLCIAVSCQMLSPISYQTNLMAYSTGGYQFADFTKLGAGLVLCIALVSIPTIEWCFPA